MFNGAVWIDCMWIHLKRRLLFPIFNHTRHPLFPQLHHGGPLPRPGSGRKQLGPRWTEHRARDHRDPRKPHPHVVLRFGRLWQVSGVCACPERLFQEVKGPGLRRIPKTAGSHLYKVFVIFNSMPGVIHKVYISMYVLQHWPNWGAAGESSQRPTQKDSVLGLWGPIQEVSENITKQQIM